MFSELQQDKDFDDLMKLEALASYHESVIRGDLLCAFRMRCVGLESESIDIMDSVRARIKIVAQVYAMMEDKIEDSDYGA